eukprot:Seg1860.9 transcript_id=Seg1860.9/GoldUCD/mRNA.D3Y31 product="hypothetical protein" protein_id=Seg1860.9/GoldUCD/D3Y31
MREEQVFTKESQTLDNMQDRKIKNIKESEFVDAINKKFGKMLVEEKSKRQETGSKRATGEEGNETAEGLKDDGTTGEENKSIKKSEADAVIKETPITITCPILIDEPGVLGEDGDANSRTNCPDNFRGNTLKPGNARLAGRRALPDITITCPPVDAFGIPDNLNTPDIFTKRRYMICKDSPGGSRRNISLVDFPSGLSALEKPDMSYLESPMNIAQSPYSFAHLDLSFIYKSPACSPLASPFTPEMRRKSKFIYPGTIPVVSVDQSFPPVEFERVKATK